MARHKTKLILTALLAAVVLFFLLEKSILPGLATKISPSRGFKMITDVTNLIKDDYVDKPDVQTTMEGGFKGLVGSLDLLSGYLDEEAMAKYQGLSNAIFWDIGVMLYKRQGAFPMVIGLREESPAQRLGLKLGDFISSLEGESTLLMSMTEVNLALKETDSRPVTLRVLGSQDNTELVIPRYRSLESPFSYAPSPKTRGILHIHHLFPGCAEAIKTQLQAQLVSQGSPLVLDLRNCAEGIMEEANRLIGLFLEPAAWGYFQRRGGGREAMTSSGRSPLFPLPLIIWTNRATTGPAELAAAVLKKYGQAKIVGQHTLGLVAEQKLVPLGDGTGMLLTTAVYHFGPEDPLWNKGIKPDIVIMGGEDRFDNYFQETKKLLSRP